MGAVEYATEYILETVDETVLELALREKHRTLNSVLSLEEKIRTQIIISKVLKDVKLLSGIRKTIPLTKCRVKQMDDTFDYVIEVPNKVLSGRDIVSASSITLAGPNTKHMSSGNSMLDASSRLVDAMSAAPIVEVTRLELIGKNIILVIVDGYEPNITSGFLECTVASGENMAHIHPRSYREFAKLCRKAAQSKIYTKLYSKLDEGYIKGGHNISRIKDIVDSFSDAEEQYDELLDGWEKIERLNNRKFNSDFIALQLGG